MKTWEYYLAIETVNAGLHKSLDGRFIYRRNMQGGPLSQWEVEDTATGKRLTGRTLFGQRGVKAMAVEIVRNEQGGAK